MKIQKLFTRIALIAGLAASPAVAVEHSAELWHVSHVSDPVSGKFNYCAVESGFDNGLYLAFARNRDFNTNIVISFPDKRLQEHTKYRMLLGVDNYPVRDTVGFAADTGILVLPLQHDRKILDWLQKGKLLDVKGPQDAVKFSLDGAQDAFKKLQQCVEQNLKDEAQGTKSPPASLPGDVAKPVDNMVMPLPLTASKAVGSPSVTQTALAQPAGQPAAVETAAPVPPVNTPSKPPASVGDVPPQAASAPPPGPPAANKAEPVSASAKPDVVVVAAPPPALSPPAAPLLPQPLPVNPAAKTLPVTPAALPPSGPTHVSLPELLAKASLSPTGKCTTRSSDCTWTSGSLLGSVVQKKPASDFLDTMMDDADRHEKECRGQFSSSIGAPATSRGLTTAEATMTCRTASTSISDVVLYVQSADKLIVAQQSAPEAKQADAVAVRAKLESGLPFATNYQ